MAGEALGPKVLQCPNCGASLVVRAQGSSVTVICGHCGSMLDATHPDLLLLAKGFGVDGPKPAFPLGTRGKLRGETWECIGFMQRSAGETEYRWCEYLLFNPRQGFRWLVENQGHWTYFKTCTDRPTTDGGHAFLGGKMYTRFDQGTAVVRYVTGEFYWRVKVGDQAQTADFIHPPGMLSSETSDGELVWSVGEYLEPSEVRSAFGATAAVALPSRIGVGANQPNKSGSSESLQMSWAIAALAIFLAFAIPNSRVHDQQIFATTFSPAPNELVTTAPFSVDYGIDNLELFVKAPVNNDWVEVEGDLVGETNEFSEEFTMGAEYYYGYDSDGSWSEGSQIGSSFFSSVPSGIYHLAFKKVGAAVPVTVAARRGVGMWSNFFVALGLISLYPLFLVWRSRRFELARWSNSDFSPSGYLSQENEE